MRVVFVPPQTRSTRFPFYLRPPAPGGPGGLPQEVSGGPGGGSAHHPVAAR